MTQTASQNIPASPPSPSSSPAGIIRLVDLHKRFGSLVVLDGLNLEIKAHESLVILGPSGAGKSVLLKHILGLLRPDSGQVYFHEERVDNKSETKLEPIRKRFGYLFQQGALFDSMTVGDNIAFPLHEQTDMPEPQVLEIVHQKLAMVGLEDTIDKYPADLSGGQKKRVALARAIALDPEVVLYDEPTTGLDPIRADVINELILKLNEEMKVTSIVVTHDMTSAFKVADRLVMLFDGKICFQGTPKEIHDSPHPQVQNFIHGRASEEDLRALNRQQKPGGGTW